MKVQMTGASGFVGRNLIQYLSADIIPVKINELDPFVVKADVVIHLAGMAHNTKANASGFDYFKVNTDLTKKAFDAFLDSSAEIFILLSSIKAVADDCNELITEETVPHPSTDYGKSKLAAEHYVLSKKLPNNKFVFVLRPALISGPGVKGNLKSLQRFSKTWLGLILSGINNKRSYCNILNLNFVVQELLDRRDVNSGVYNIADNEFLSTGEIVRLLSKRAYINRYIRKLSFFAVNFVRLFAKMMHIHFIEDSMEKLTGNYMISSRKLKNALGKTFPFSAADGIRSI